MNFEVTVSGDIRVKGYGIIIGNDGNIDIPFNSKLTYQELLDITSMATKFRDAVVIGNGTDFRKEVKDTPLKPR